MLQDISNVRILVVDDEPDVGELFRQKFRREIREGKLHFEFAENGRVALERVQADPSIQVVFTDLNMPEMNGLEFLKHLKELSKPALKSVVISAYGDMANIRTAMHAGAMDFIIKPIDLQDLEATLWKCCKEVDQALTALVAMTERAQLQMDVAIAEQTRKQQLEFFDNVTHELRTPLTLLIGPLELAIDRLPESEIRDHLLMARRNGEHLMRLVEELLEAARVDSGGVPLRPVYEDLAAILRLSADLFEPMARAKNIQFQVQGVADPFLCVFDPPKIQKIVGNLLSNAFKFTPEGGEIVLALDRTTDGMAQVSVKDSGVGIAADMLEKVFDRFVKSDGPKGGTGIGLSLASTLAKLHGGRLSVQSAEGQGTTFTLTMPIRLPDQQSQAEPTPPPVNAHSEEISILVVEDNADMRRYISQSLPAGVSYILAENGADGLRAANEHIPDLIISDWMMPEMDGMELLRRIRQDANTSHIPVVMLTAKSDAEHKLSGITAGADAYLSKPFQPAELQAVIHNALRLIRLNQAKTRKEVLTQPAVKNELSIDDAFLMNLRAALQRELANELFGVEELAEALNVSRKTLHRKVTALTGQAPNPFIRSFRLEAAMQMLKNQSHPIGEVAHLTGFSSHSYFSKCFQEYFNLSPSEV